MLTNDLVRVRRQKGKIYPRYLDVQEEEAKGRAAALVAIFEESLGQEKRAIDEQVEEAIGYGTDFVIWRGLAKLLYDRSEFGVDAGAEPERIREVVFRRAMAAGNPHKGAERQAVLELAGRELGIEAREVERGLYADLEERQVLEKFKKISPDQLLERYNVALAQAVLYRALSMRIRLGVNDSNKLRLLFQMLKFHRLMHRTERAAAGYEIIVDGPGSLLKQGRRYGLAMAKFLPALLHLDGWEMEARIEWDGRRFIFELDPSAGLKAVSRARGQWVAQEEQWFEERFAQKAPKGWSLERRGEVVELGENEVLVTDYVIRTDDGEEALLEVVGFWRAAYLRRRLELLGQMELERPVILVVSERLNSDRELLEASPAQVVFFKGVILHDKVVEAVRAGLGARF